MRANNKRKEKKSEKSNVIEKQLAQEIMTGIDGYTAPMKMKRKK